MSDCFSALPNEIFHEILVAAVVVRGTRRGTRLRYVSRTWNAAVMDAIFASRILDAGEAGGPAYWGRYIVFRSLGRPGGLSRPLRIIRQVGECLAAHRSSDDDGHCFTDAALRDCVFEVCAILDVRSNLSLTYSELRRADAGRESSPSVDGNDEQFKQALLAAASWANELTLVRELLPSFQGCEALICQDGSGEYAFRPIFGYPICLAAFRGHDEVVRLLTEAAARGRHGIHALLSAEVLRFAALGNQLSILNLVLGIEYPSWDPWLVSGLEGTTSVEVFKKLLPLARDNLQREFQKRPHHFHQKFLPRQLMWAAAAGNLAMMEHLVELGAVPLPAGGLRQIKKTRDPVYAAASNGRKEALVLLLGKGFPMTTQSILAAVRYGDLKTVEVALDHFDGACSVSQLLSVAEEKENGPVYRRLLSFGESRMVA